MSECEYNVRKISLSEPTYDGPMVEEMEMEERIDDNVSEMTMDARLIRA
jgi:hypothetical protein